MWFIKTIKLKAQLGFKYSLFDTDFAPKHSVWVGKHDNTVQICEWPVPQHQHINCAEEVLQWEKGLIALAFWHA